MQGALRKDYSVAAQNLWDKDPGAWTGYLAGRFSAWKVGKVGWKVPLNLRKATKIV